MPTTVADATSREVISLEEKLNRYTAWIRKAQVKVEEMQRRRVELVHGVPYSANVRRPCVSAECRVVLEKAKGLTSAQLVAELKRAGLLQGSRNPQAAVTVALRRHPLHFKKAKDGRWYLIK